MPVLWSYKAAALLFHFCCLIANLSSFLVNYHKYSPHFFFPFNVNMILLMNHDIGSSNQSHHQRKKNVTLLFFSLCFCCLLYLKSWENPLSLVFIEINYVILIEYLTKTNTIVIITYQNEEFFFPWINILRFLLTFSAKFGIFMRILMVVALF